MRNNMAKPQKLQSQITEDYLQTVRDETKVLDAHPDKKAIYEHLLTAFDIAQFEILGQSKEKVPLLQVLQQRYPRASTFYSADGETPSSRCEDFIKAARFLKENGMIKPGVETTEIDQIIVKAHTKLESLDPKKAAAIPLTQDEAAVKKPSKQAAKSKVKGSLLSIDKQKDKKAKNLVQKAKDIASQLPENFKLDESAKKSKMMLMQKAAKLWRSITGKPKDSLNRSASVSLPSNKKLDIKKERSRSFSG